MMRVEGEWLSHPGTCAVMEMLSAAGYQAYFVGGCVRNAALDAPISDIDIASDARPEQVMEIAEANGLKAVGTGIEHGTVTIVAQGLAHEITTFRRDVETDGRRAVVAFSTDIAEDAARRDFTMNALYAQLDGTVLDPTGDGIADLVAGRIRFIGSAEERIREDYLRILRFFRFHAWYAEPGFEPDTLADISALTSGIDTISKERIGQEMRKLLAAPDPAPQLATMDQIGLLMRLMVGAEPQNIAPLVAVEKRLDQPADWTTRMAALGGQGLMSALRLSKSETRQIKDLREGLESTQQPGPLGYRLGALTATHVLMLREALLQQPVLDGHLEDAARGAAASFPVRAADLPDALKGPAIGDKLQELEIRWIKSGFSLSRDELLM